MAAEQLLVTEGKEPGALLSVEAEMVLGRLAPDQEGRLGGDPEISRRHARVSRGADRSLEIEDLGSANGTFVNAERIDAPRALRVGDVVRLGRTVLEVTGAEEATWELVVTAGNARGRRLELLDELVLGRASIGEGRLSDDPELSRRHARVARDASGRLGVEDLGSANGTFVNGERVSALRLLNPGDSLRVGTTTLELSRAGRRPAAAAETPPAATAPPAAPVQEPAPAVPAARSTQPDPGIPAGPILPLGSVFAGCRVEEVISHGDMGVVYRADELALQRPVALKLILPEYSQDERFRERFRRESKITAAIGHPNVIPVFDAGEQDGLLYIMMRLVEGTDLRALIDAEGPLDPLRAARIVRQVGAALDAAHACGMLHRDVKPSNVLLARQEHVYLTDFGLAKRADASKGLTRHGTVVARAEYVAPEQILNQRVDGRADTYALSCLLFEALTGEAPFARYSGGPGALAHLEAPRPSPLDLRPDLPAEFGDVVRRGMATDPEERYPSAGDLGQAALVAAGVRRRARPWSMVATGEAAPPGAGQAPQAAPVPVPGSTAARRPSLVRWAIALAGLAIVAAGSVAALIGISGL
jgi:pSer/pThr/pTyr-binding forkhead associated (FHA) protein/predicted Ser/Thr protein kinase